MMRAGLYRPVHVKRYAARSRTPPTHRKLLQSKAIAIENDLRATLRNFGQLGMVGAVKFEALIGAGPDSPRPDALGEPSHVVRAGCCASRSSSSTAASGPRSDDDVCRRLINIPGVGPVVALTFRVTVGVPARVRTPGRSAQSWD